MIPRPISAKLDSVAPLQLLDAISPHARVATAILPFVAAMIIRLMFGKSRVIGWMITLSTVWFTVNILMAPYSDRMRQDLRDVSTILR